MRRKCPTKNFWEPCKIILRALWCCRPNSGKRWKMILFCLYSTIILVNLKVTKCVKANSTWIRRSTSEMTNSFARLMESLISRWCHTCTDKKCTLGKSSVFTIQFTNQFGTTRLTQMRVQSTCGSQIYQNTRISALLTTSTPWNWRQAIVSSYQHSIFIRSPQNPKFKSKKANINQPPSQLVWSMRVPPTSQKRTTMRSNSIY